MPEEVGNVSRDKNPKNKFFKTSKTLQQKRNDSQKCLV